MDTDLLRQSQTTVPRTTEAPIRAMVSNTIRSADHPVSGFAGPKPVLFEYRSSGTSLVTLAVSQTNLGGRT